MTVNELIIKDHLTLAKSYKNQINEKRPFGQIKIPQSTPADVGPDWQQYSTGLGGGPCHHELGSWQCGLLERRAQTLAHGFVQSDGEAMGITDLMDKNLPAPTWLMVGQALAGLLWRRQ